jgi:hypothetical protein
MKEEGNVIIGLFWGTLFKYPSLDVDFWLGKDY